MTFLDRTSAEPGDPPPPEDAPESDWVSFIESSGMPSLYGENRAIFNVALTAKGARFVLASFDGFIPAGVVYELKYVAMQRAYQVKVEADWSIVYHFVQEHDKDRFLFFSSDVENIVEKLIEDKTIKIVASIEGVGDEGMEGEYAEARKQLTKFVFDQFFEPKINPRALLDKDVPGGIISMMEGLRDGGLPLQFSYSKRTLDTEQIRSFAADYSTARAVERTIAPQGHLSVFWEDLGVTKDQVVTVIEDRDQIFRQVPFRILSSALYGEDAIAHIIVAVVYGELDGDEPGQDARTFSVVLDTTHTSGAIRDWFDPTIGLVFHYRYTVVFGPKAIVGSDVLMTSKWDRVVGDQVAINPLELFEERRFLFQRSGLLKIAVFPEVVVQLRYVDPATGWTFDRSAVLDTEKGNWATAFRIGKGAGGQAEYRLQFLSEDGNIETDWLPAKADLNVIDDPRENLVDVRLLFPGNADLEQAIVNLEHSDPAHGIHDEETIVVTKAGFADKHSWQFRRAPGAPARYRYSYVLLRTDGEVVSTGWTESEAPTLVVGGKDARKWQIRPELIGPPLSQNGLDKIVVALSYADAANDYRVDKAITLTTPGPGEPMMLELRDLSARDYSYMITYHMTNGFTKRVGPIGSSAAFPVISSVPPQ
jgi:hypothetical protein